jgi:hypothetical protein
MKAKQTILKNIESNKDLMKRINNEKYSSIEDFYNNALRYIKAIKEGRVINSIGSVSSSGMSRTIKFCECSGSIKKRYRYYNFYLLFKLLDFTPVKDSDYFRVNGCGMDMVFHTNYTIIHVLYRLGFMTKKECENLAQQTPTTI